MPSFLFNETTFDCFRSQHTNIIPQVFPHHHSFPDLPSRDSRNTLYKYSKIHRFSVSETKRRFAIGFFDLGGKENLLLIVIFSVVNDVEEAELVNTLGGGDNAKPVTELVLLEELLGTVHKLSLECAT